MIMFSEARPIFSPFLYTVLTIASCSLTWVGSSRIVGGSRINITDAPFQVSVQLGGSMICGGVILTPLHVATAAHCIIRDTSYFSVRAGTTDHVMGGTVHFAANITIHPKYNDTLYDFDVAIIKLDQIIQLDEFRQPISLMTSSNLTKSVTITGWGTTAEDDGTSRYLQSVTIPVVNDDVCNNNYEEYGGITDRMFCAGAVNHDSCYGDSGGPVVTEDQQLAGIVSWGVGCARPGYPGVNTKLFHPKVADFIKGIIEN